MPWIMECPQCGGTCLDTDTNHLCFACRKLMVKKEKVDDDYVKGMSNRGYWIKRKQLEVRKAAGSITQKEYEKELKYITKHFLRHKGGPNLLVAIDRPLIIPQAKPTNKKVFYMGSLKK